MTCRQVMAVLVLAGFIGIVTANIAPSLDNGKSEVSVLNKHPNVSFFVECLDCLKSLLWSWCPDPPPSYVKCFLATVAGSLFALFGLIQERSVEIRTRQAARECIKLGDSAVQSIKETRTAELAVNLVPEPTSCQAIEEEHREVNKVTPKPATKRTAVGSGGVSFPSSRPQFGRHLSESEKVERQVKSILNKLTRERFDTLYTQLCDCIVGEDRQKVIEIVAKEVFVKATQQHNFVDMYADLCTKLHSELGDSTCAAHFKNVLLTQCEESFNRHLIPPTFTAGLSYEEEYEEVVKYKTKMLGNSRLIAHLLIGRMLSPKILPYCINALLVASTPETVETLCVFLSVVGGTLDTCGKLDNAFTQLEALVVDSSPPPRVRCLIQDILDRRRSGWRNL